MASPPGISPREPRAAIVLLGIACATLLAYVRSFDVPFLWDDVEFVAREDVRSLGSVWHYLSTEFPPGSQGAPYYRPLYLITLALDRAVWGGGAAGFHATNLAVHLAAVALVFALARRAGAATLGAGVAALAFALAPRLVEAVTWIAGRTDSLPAAFGLASLLTWRRGSWPHRLGAAALALCALLCKESGGAAVIAIAAREALEARREGRSVVRGALSAWPVAAAGAVYFALRRHAVPAVEIDTSADGRPALVMRPLVSLGMYVVQTLDAFRPRTHVGLTADWYHPGLAALGAATAAAALALGVYAWRRWTPDRFALLVLGAAALLPALHLGPVASYALNADRRLYVPFAALAALIASAAPGWTPIVRQVAALAAAAFAVAGGIAVHLRHADMTSSLRFWAVTAVQVRLDDPLPRTNLAMELQQAGHPADAAAVWRAALRDSFPLAKASYVPMMLRVELGRCLSRLGRTDEAAALARENLALQPDLAAHWSDLALAEARALDFAAARATLAEAIARGLDGSGRLARHRASLDAAERALAALPAASSPDAHAPAALRARAEWFDRLGRSETADASWIALAEAEAAPLDAFGAAVSRLVRSGSIAAARRAVSAASRRAPRDPATANARAWLAEREEQERAVEAVEPLLAQLR